MDAVLREKNGQKRVEFTCWDCGAKNGLEIGEIKGERLSIRYHGVKMLRKETDTYYIACTACKRFNRLRF